jgi:hypothetical protein
VAHTGLEANNLLLIEDTADQLRAAGQVVGQLLLADLSQSLAKRAVDA